MCQDHAGLVQPLSPSRIPCPVWICIKKGKGDWHPTAQITLLKLPNTLLCSDVDTACSVRSIVAETRQIHRTTESCGGKGTSLPLSQEKSALTLALTGFIAFLGTLH